MLRDRFEDDRIGPTGMIDLRRAPLADVRAIDLRSLSLDFWSDEAACWNRFDAVGAGLDDAAWRYPGAAPSDAGGSDWSFLDHFAHVGAWQELAIEYVDRAELTAVWPSDEDYDGGDFDRFNERLRADWTSIDPAELRARARDSHDRLVERARRLTMETIRSDVGWGWVYMGLHGHQLDHLSILEPWAETLRSRQAEGDPFATDEGSIADPTTPLPGFLVAEGIVHRQFEETVRAVPQQFWEQAAVTPGWTLKDHVAHIAAWFEEASEAVEDHLRSGGWRGGPNEGVDAWNARAAARDRHLTPTAALERFDLGRRRLLAAVRSLTPDDLRDPEGWSWAYEDLHGHIRQHLAMVGPFCARVGWLAVIPGGVDPVPSLAGT